MPKKSKTEFAIDIGKALDKISGSIVRTPLLRSEEFSRAFGCNLYFKYEHLQITGSVKARGAFLKVPSKKTGVRQGYVTASTGNHGFGMALAAQRSGSDFKLFMPTTVDRQKIQKAQFLGADISLCGASWDEANQAALAFSKESGWEFVHTFDDETVVAGHATAALECLQEHPKFDVALCSIGGGGLARGFLGSLKEDIPSIRCYGVETFGAESMFLSLKNGKITTLPKIASKATSIGIKAPTVSTFEFARKNLDGLAVVGDHAAAVSQIHILDCDKQLVELAASCCVAALEANLIPDIKGKDVLVLLCGGNVLSSELGIEKEIAPQVPAYLPIGKSALHL
jgi:threonine dehydratase